MPDWLVLWIHERWDAILSDPASSLICVAAGLVVAYAFSKWLYHRQIANLETAGQIKDERLAAFADKLHGASPDEAAGKISALAGQVENLRTQIHELEDANFPFSDEERKRLKRVLEGIPEAVRFPVRIGYAAMGAAQKYAKRMERAFNTSGWKASINSNLTLTPEGAGIAIALSPKVAGDPQTWPQEASLLHFYLRTAGIVVDMVEFDEMKDDAYQFLVGIPREES